MQVRVSHERIAVTGNEPFRRNQVSTLVDNLEPPRVIDIRRFSQVPGRGQQQVVGHKPAEVPGIRRPQERKHQVRPRAQTPVAQCLTKILRALRQIEHSGHIYQPAQAKNRVVGKSTHRYDGRLALQLKKTVGEVTYFTQVIEEISDSAIRKVRHNGTIPFRNGAEEPVINGFVEAIDLPVPILIGIDLAWSGIKLSFCHVRID